MNFFTGIFLGFWPKISKDIIQNTDSQNSYIRWLLVNNLENSFQDWPKSPPGGTYKGGAYKEKSVSVIVYRGVSGSKSFNKFIKNGNALNPLVPDDPKWSHIQ